MNTGEIILPLNIFEFAPGDVISGTVRWSVGRKPESGVVTLFWYVEQRDGPHIYPVKRLPIPHPAEQGEYGFSFTAPPGPCSYAGTLFSIEWAVELLLEPNLLDIRSKLVLAPDRTVCSFQS